MLSTYRADAAANCSAGCPHGWEGVCVPLLSLGEPRQPECRHGHRPSHLRPGLAGEGKDGGRGWLYVRMRLSAAALINQPRDLPQKTTPPH